MNKYVMVMLLYKNHSKMNAIFGHMVLVYLDHCEFAALGTKNSDKSGQKNGFFVAF